MTSGVGVGARDRDQLSGSCLCFLFADLFVPPMSRWHRLIGVPGVVVPSSKSMVALGQLEAMMVAVAIWELRTQGCLAMSWLEPEEQRLITRGDGIRLSLQLSPTQGAAVTSGLENRLLLALDGGSCDLYELIIKRWLDDRSPAANEVIVLAQREALSRGLLSRQPREGRPHRSLSWSNSLPDYTGVADALTGFLAGAQRLSEDLAALEESKTDEWLVLRRESVHILLHARPVFKMDTGSYG